MKLREKPSIDYRQLHQGPKLSSTSSKRERWSISKLWRFEIIDERDHEVKVHWEGWTSSYDQWISRESVIDVPDNVDQADAFSHFSHQLYIQVRFRV